MARSDYGLGSGVEPNSQDANFRISTFQDAIDRAGDFVTSGGGNGQNRIVKQAVLEAYDELCQAHEWNYFFRPYRVQVYASVTGDCTYTSSTRTFTIDSGTWPTWATAGTTIRISSVNYLIRERTSGTALLADTIHCPQDDLAAGTDFEIFRQYYRLPADFRAMTRPLDEQADYWSHYVSPEQWHSSQRYDTQQASPWCWSIIGDQYETGRMCLAVTPGYDTDRTIDFVMQRYPRPLIYDGNSTFCRVGTVAVTTSSVTGTSTTFEANMAGAILRIARSSATTVPDGQGGNNPFERQAYISQDVSITTTTCGIEGSWSVTGRKYTISDPLDLSPPMMIAFFRGCEYKLAQKLQLKNKESAKQDYFMALADAKSADMPARVSRSCWDSDARLSIHDRAIDGADSF